MAHFQRDCVEIWGLDRDNGKASSCSSQRQKQWAMRVVSVRVGTADGGVETLSLPPAAAAHFVKRNQRNKRPITAPARAPIPARVPRRQLIGEARRLIVSVLWDGYQLRRKWRRDAFAQWTRMAVQERIVMMIQALARGFLYRWGKRRVHEAATVIQSNYRAFYYSTWRGYMLVRRWRATLDIQRVWRAKCGRYETKRKLQRKYVRAHFGIVSRRKRWEQSRAKERQVAAACLIQRYAVLAGRMKAAARLQRRTKAVSLLTTGLDADARNQRMFELDIERHFWRGRQRKEQAERDAVRSREVRRGMAENVRHRLAAEEKARKAKLEAEQEEKEMIERTRRANKWAKQRRARMEKARERTLRLLHLGSTKGDEEEKREQVALTERVTDMHEELKKGGDSEEEKRWADAEFNEQRLEAARRVVEAVVEEAGDACREEEAKSESQIEARRDQELMKMRGEREAAFEAQLQWATAYVQASRRGCRGRRVARALKLTVWRKRYDPAQDTCYYFDQRRVAKTRTRQLTKAEIAAGMSPEVECHAMADNLGLMLQESAATAVRALTQPVTWTRPFCFDSEEDAPVLDEWCIVEPNAQQDPPFGFTRPVALFYNHAHAEMSWSKPRHACPNMTLDTADGGYDIAALLRPIDAWVEARRGAWLAALGARSTAQQAMKRCFACLACEEDVSRCRAALDSLDRQKKWRRVSVDESEAARERLDKALQRAEAERQSTRYAEARAEQHTKDVAHVRVKLAPVAIKYRRRAARPRLTPQARRFVRCGALLRQQALFFTRRSQRGLPIKDEVRLWLAKNSAGNVIQEPEDVQRLARGLEANMSAREAQRIFGQCSYQVRSGTFGIPHKKMCLWWEGKLECCAEDGGDDFSSDTSNTSDDEFSEEQEATDELNAPEQKLSLPQSQPSEAQQHPLTESPWHLRTRADVQPAEQPRLRPTCTKPPNAVVTRNAARLDRMYEQTGFVMR